MWRALEETEKQVVKFINVLPFLDRVSGEPYAPHACAASLCPNLVGRDLSMNYPRSRPRLLLPQQMLKRAG
jgi:hypothetical protein